MSPQLATRAPGSTTTGDPGQITAPCEGVPSPQEGLWNSEVGKGVWRMVWKEKGRVRPLHFQRSSAAKEGGQEGKAFSSLSLNAPHPQTHRCQTALVKKTSLQTHSDFWEAAQLYSLSSSPLPGQFPEVGVGGGDWGESWVSGRGEGPTPVRSLPDLTSSAAAIAAGTPPSGRPQAPQEGRKVPKTAGFRFPGALPTSRTLPATSPPQSG